MENCERRSAIQCRSSSKNYGAVLAIDDQLITTQELIKGEYKKYKSKGTNVQPLAGELEKIKEWKEVKRFKKLKYADRVKIEELLKKDCSKDEIADQLHVHRATIYREIARTGEPYSAEEAQRRLTGE